jgi:hypothetical protein
LALKISSAIAAISTLLVLLPGASPSELKSRQGRLVGGRFAHPERRATAVVANITGGWHQSAKRVKSARFTQSKAMRQTAF